MAEEIQNSQESLIPESAPVESITPVPQQEVNPDAPRGDLFSGILDQNIDNTSDYVKLNFEEIKDIFSHVKPGSLYFWVTNSNEPTTTREIF